MRALLTTSTLGDLNITKLFPRLRLHFQNQLSVLTPIPVRGGLTQNAKRDIKAPYVPLVQKAFTSDLTPA